MGLTNGTDPLSVSIWALGGSRALKWRETPHRKNWRENKGQVPEKGRENDMPSEDKHGVLPSLFEKAFSYVIEENDVKYHTLP